MRTTDFSRIVRKIALPCLGRADGVPTEDWDGIRESVDTRLREVWGATHWPEWQPIEPRYVRPEHDSTSTYAEGDEVYSLDEGAYYVALQSVPAGIDITNTAYWEETEIDPVEIPYEQTGETTMGEALRVWDADPRRSAGARLLDWELTTTPGIDLLRAGVNQVWVQYRLPAPRLEGDTWQSAVTYGSGVQVYWETAAGAGNFYVSLASSNTAAPSDTTKWAVVEIPAVLEAWLVKCGQADWMATDGQQDKSLLYEQQAGQLYDQMTDLVARQQGQLLKIDIKPNR